MEFAKKIFLFDYQHVYASNLRVYEEETPGFVQNAGR